MKNIADFSIWIKQLSLEVKKQTVAVRELAVNFADGEQRQVRHDQAAFPRSLKTRIMREVEDIRRTESAAQIGSTEAIFLGGLAAFASGGLWADKNRPRDALNIGMRMAGSVLSRKIPFGTILIAIREKGLPGDLAVVPLSRLARESGKSELEVEASLKDNRYLLMTTEVFAKVLEKVEREILDGSVSLPMAVDQVIERIV